MKKTMLKFVMLFVITTFMISCYPGDTDYEDLDTTTTVYEKANFNPAPQSVTIFWSVTQLKGDDDNNIEYHGQIDNEILNTTLDNLVNLYGVENVTIFSVDENPSPTPSNSQVTVITPQDDEADSDTRIVPAIVLRQNTGVGIVYPPIYWYPPGWGCYYCWYTPMPYTYDYEVGTVLLNMMDHRNASVDSPSWVATMRGLLSSANVFSGDRAVGGINQAFDQSPYLN